MAGEAVTPEYVSGGETVVVLAVSSAKTAVTTPLLAVFGRCFHAFTRRTDISRSVCRSDR